MYILYAVIPWPD